MSDSASSIVFLVDDDVSVRESVASLLRSVGLTVRAYANASEYLAADRPDLPGCLILDVRMPGLSGLDLQDELTRHGIGTPVIFITGHGDIPMTVRAMKAGAVEFLPKPFRDQELLDAVQHAIEADRIRRVTQAERMSVQSRFERLSPREREVFAYVVTGMLNKQVASELGTSEITIKVHRAAIMQKMQADSLPDLVRMAERLGLEPPRR